MARHAAFHLKAGHPVVVGIEEKGITGNRLHPLEPCPDNELLGDLHGIGALAQNERHCNPGSAGQEAQKQDAE